MPHNEHEREDTRVSIQWSEPEGAWIIRVEGDAKIATGLADIGKELVRAQRLHPRPQSSMHEGLAVLEEEVQEVRTIVYQKQSERDLGKLAKELVQVGAMALRSLVEVIGEGRGRV